jgi:tricorn protease
MSDHRLSLRSLSSIVATLLLTATSVGEAAPADSNVDLPRFPAVSPDGSEVVFSWRGDLWKAPTTSGRAIRLTSHPQDDLFAVWSRDGSRLAFSSDRNGYMNIYMMDADGTGLQQLTDVDQGCRVTGFGEDDQGNEVVLFHARMEGDVYRDWRPYMVSTDGGPIRRLHDAFGSYPVMSPDKQHLVFTRGGIYDAWQRHGYRGPDAVETWLYTFQDGSFQQLTHFDGTDGKPRWADDDTILFLSDRSLDRFNLYRMSATAGDAQTERLTNFGGRDVFDFDVSADGSLVVMSVWDTLYALDLDDANAKPRPIRILASEDDTDNYELKQIDREVTEAALSPDGKVMAVVAYGEVYVRNVEDGSPTRRVTDDHAREKDIAWSPDGLKLFFTSDRGEGEAIYAATVKMTRSEVKESFEKSTGKQADVVDETEEPETSSEAAGTGDDKNAAGDDPLSGTWSGTAEIPEEGPAPFTLTLRLDSDGSVTGDLDAGPYSGPVTGQFDAGSGSLTLSVTTGQGMVITFDLELSNGELSGTAAAGDIVAEITATRTDIPDAGTADEESDEGDKPSKKDKKKELPKELQPDRWHDAIRFNIEPIVQRSFNVRGAAPSPDGKSLAYRGTRGDVWIMDLDTGEHRPLLEGWDPWTDFKWSPDGRHIAYASNNLNFNSDIFIVPADGSSEPVNITRHPDNESNPVWSADGKILAFVSERINEELDVWRVYLDKELEALTPQELEDYYENAVKAAKKRKPLAVEPPEEAGDDEDEKSSDADGDEAKGDDPAEDEKKAADDDQVEDEPEPLDLDDAYLRVRRITSLEGNEYGITMTPGGDRIIFNARGDSPGLYSIKWDRSGQKRIGGNANVQHVTLTGDKVVTVSGGQARTVKPTGGTDTIGINDRIRIDLQKQSVQKFLEAARTLGEQYYHPEMGGVDWDAATEDYLDLVKGARTANEFNFVANRFIGETGGSHLGVYARGDGTPNRQAYGRLGIDHERVDDGFEVTNIVPDSPAASGPMALEVGDVITAVEFEPFQAGDTLLPRFKGLVGEETVITVRREAEDDEPLELDLLITPISFGAERGLRYEAWRHANARAVEERSDGRLGYIHIQGMNQPSLDVFERDLFAAAYGKDGLVLDVRNNGGGWTTDRVLSSIMVTPHAYTIPRGVDWSRTGFYPQDRLFIQRYSMPMNLLCNEKSYSNAEIMSHAFKTLERGTLVGQQTHGSVISTGGFALIDGTFVRLPFRGWFVAPTGNDMELNGAMPDLVVPQTPQDEVANRDRQLETAVDDLLERLD